MQWHPEPRTSRNLTRRAFLILLPFGALLTRPAFAEKLHKVRKNENLSSIASRYGVTTADLIRYNNLSNPDRLSIGQELRIPPGKGVAKKYTVKKGDVLGTIARKHGVSTAALIRFNNIKNPKALQVGHVLLIPDGKATGSSSSSAALAPALPYSLRKQLQKIPVNRWKWKYIVIHHSATKQGSAKGMDRYHKEERRMVNGLAYHFVIGNGRGMGDGEIAIGNRWKRQIKGGHVASTALNQKSIGICLVGNFDKTKPTAAQVRSLKALLAYLKEKAHLKSSAVKTHREINPRPTRCPGKYFPDHLI